MEESVMAKAGQTAGRRADGGGGRGPGWQSAVVPVLVAVVLSVAVTLLLGGAFRAGTAGAGAAGPWGAVGACCPPGATASGNR